MNFIAQILCSQYFDGHPPVLIDIGASGGINKAWEEIAAYSYCICFDADDRDFSIFCEEDRQYKKLIKINRAVTEHSGISPFFFTASPHCSSCLQPDNEALKPWLFASCFDLVKTSELESTTIAEVLKSANINHIDWLKLDTQGTDLRLYKSLPDEVRRNILAVEMEPGIIDAYKSEDKLSSVLYSMEEDNFWLSRIEVKGSIRIEAGFVSEFGEGNISRAIPVAPGWAELTFLRNATSDNARSLLLLYVFAVLQRQHGFAFEICQKIRSTNIDFPVDDAVDYVKSLINSHNLKKVSFKNRVKNYLVRKLQN